MKFSKAIDEFLQETAIGTECEMKVIWGRNVWIKCILLGDNENGILVEYPNRQQDFLMPEEIMYIVVGDKGYNNYKKTFPFIVGFNLINAALGLFLAFAFYFILIKFIL